MPAPTLYFADGSKVPYYYYTDANKFTAQTDRIMTEISRTFMKFIIPFHPRRRSGQLTRLLQAVTLKRAGLS